MMSFAVSRRPAQNRLLLAAAVVFLSLSAASAMMAIRPARAAQTVQVIMGDNYYSPQVVTINIGDTVQWVNQGSMVHTATADTGQPVYWNSGDIGAGGTYSYTFLASGNFTYSCAYHDMAGKVDVVQPAPEFPGFAVLAVLALGVGLGLLVERRIRS